MNRYCEICNKEVSRSPSRNSSKLVFCSNGCRFAYYEGLHIVCICPECGTSFKRTKEQINKYLHNFCSRKCSSTYNLTKRGGTISASRRTDLSPYMYVLRCIKSRALHRARKIELSIGPSYIKNLFDSQKGICPYTKHPLIVPYPGDRATITGDLLSSASLDRIDSTKGYIEGNVEWVSLGINYLKNDKSKNDVLKFITHIQGDAGN